jgi:hypothetical protein
MHGYRPRVYSFGVVYAEAQGSGVPEGLYDQVVRGESGAG